MAASLGLLSLALVAAGCSVTQAGGEQRWAARAEQWFGAFYTAAATGWTNQAAFYADDVLVDAQGLLGYQGVGRAGVVQAFRDSAQKQPVFVGGRDITDTERWVRTEPVYLSVDGAVDPVRAGSSVDLII